MSPVRASAITLFGKLARFGGGPSRAPFLEQIHANFIALLLHLNEDGKDVIAVRVSIASVISLLDCAT